MYIISYKSYGNTIEELIKVQDIEYGVYILALDIQINLFYQLFSYTLIMLIPYLDYPSHLLVLQHI